MALQMSRTRNTEEAIWARVISRKTSALCPDAAESILKLQFSPRDIKRMNVLAAKARNGQLSLSEQEEVENYSHVGSVLGILKSKAREAPQRKSKANGKGELNQDGY